MARKGQRGLKKIFKIFRKLLTNKLFCDILTAKNRTQTVKEVK